MELDTKSAYANKIPEYFSHARKEIDLLLPRHSEKVLEIGCGEGQTLRWLQDTGKVEETFGVEVFMGAVTTAKQYLDNILCANIEKEDVYEGEQFDLILALDVLEHLENPWLVLNKLVGNKLKAGGVVVASIPNVRHFSVLVPLLFKSEWEYGDSGVLDKTHLRFFTKSSATSLIESSGLFVNKIIANPSDITNKQISFNRLTFNLFHDILSQQYIIAATKL